MNFSDRLAHTIGKKKSCLILGLDPSKDKMPKYFHHQAISRQENDEKPQAVWAKMYTEFCLRMMMACEPFICGIKIQMAYFEVLGSHGILAVEHLISVGKEKGLIVLVDGKRNDIGSTCDAYAQAYLEDGSLGADALTVTPFLGSDGVAPFVKRCKQNDRGIFVLTRTSNPSSEEFQPSLEEALVEKMNEWGKSTIGKCGFSSVGSVVGATQGGALEKFRKALPNTWFLAPGVGAQGGSMEDVMAASRDGLGVIIPVSRAVLYASDKEDFMEKGAEAMEQLFQEQKGMFA